MKRKNVSNTETVLGVRFTVNPNLKPVPSDHPVLAKKLAKANYILANAKGLDELLGRSAKA